MRIAQADVPKTETIVCETCGKSHMVFWGRFVYWRDKNFGFHKFCSPKCKENYIKANAVCKFCGKILSNGYYFSNRGEHAGYYCDKDCFEKAHLVENICPYCGKTFFKKNPTTYCSRICYLASVKRK